MKIGKYIIDDYWEEYEEECHIDLTHHLYSMRSIYDSYSHEYVSYIDLFISETFYPGKFVVGYSIFFMAHKSLFGNQYPNFDSENEAKEHVDLFLNKLARLVVFV